MLPQHSLAIWGARWNIQPMLVSTSKSTARYSYVLSSGWRPSRKCTAIRRFLKRSTWNLRFCIHCRLRIKKLSVTTEIEILYWAISSVTILLLCSYYAALLAITLLHYIEYTILKFDYVTSVWMDQIMPLSLVFGSSIRRAKYPRCIYHPGRIPGIRNSCREISTFLPRYYGFLIQDEKLFQDEKWKTRMFHFHILRPTQILIKTCVREARSLENSFRIVLRSFETHPIQYNHTV